MLTEKGALGNLHAVSTLQSWTNILRGCEQAQNAHIAWSAYHPSFGNWKVKRIQVLAMHSTDAHACKHANAPGAMCRPTKRTQVHQHTTTCICSLPCALALSFFSRALLSRALFLSLSRVHAHMRACTHTHTGASIPVKHGT